MRKTKQSSSVLPIPLPSQNKQLEDDSNHSKVSAVKCIDSSKCRSLQIVLQRLSDEELAATTGCSEKGKTYLQQKKRRREIMSSAAASLSDEKVVIFLFTNKIENIIMICKSNNSQGDGNTLKTNNGTVLQTLKSSVSKSSMIEKVKRHQPVRQKQLKEIVSSSIGPIANRNMVTIYSDI